MPESKAVAEPELWPDLQPLLDQELSRLPDKYRVAIILCDLEGKTRKVVARQLKIPEGTLSSRLTTARRMLAKRLGRHGLPVSGGALALTLSQKMASACVPPSIVSSTIKAATQFAAGKALTEMISMKVAALTEGVLKTMLLTKLKTMMVVVGTLGIITLFLGFSGYYGFAQQSVNENKTEPIKLAAEEPATKPDAKKSEPQYGWLVFGPKGKVRALVRLNGEEVSVDRDGDGKFDSKGERFKSEKDCKDVVITDPDGKTSYVITYVHALHTTPPEKFLEVRVRIRGAVTYPQTCLIQLGDKPRGAPEAHFNGPLTIAPKGWNIVNRASRLVENDLVDVGSLLPQSLKGLAGKTLYIESTLPKSLKRIGEPTNLWAGVVTEGENSLVSVCSPDDTDEGRRVKSPFPNGVHPFVDVEFPAKKPGDPPVKVRYPLDQHSGDGFYRGPVRVPDKAGGGKAKVTFSFDAWQGAKVASTTVEIPIDEAQEEGKDQKPKPDKEQAAHARKEHDKQGSDQASGLSPVTPSYVVEPPDILLLEVAGLPKKSQVIDGEYLVRPNGTISLGDYGDVAVAGRSLSQLRVAIADHLEKHAVYAKLDVLVNVVGYNSKVFYVITKGQDGEQVLRFPHTSGETVVGAILKVKGLALRAISGRVWLARPSGEVLDVNWRVITQEGKSDTNYLIRSGDRVFVEGPLPK